jgi:hypothetical protein
MIGAESEPARLSGDRQILAAPFVTQLSKRAGISLPHSPRPDPAMGVNGCWRTAALYAMGTNAATGRPHLVITVDRPLSAASRRAGS